MIVFMWSLCYNTGHISDNIIMLSKLTTYDFSGNNIRGFSIIFFVLMSIDCYTV